MWLRSVFASLLALAALASLAPLLNEHVTRPKYNVILLTVESLRAEMVSDASAPQLRAAAVQGLSFTQHRAVSAWTAPNIIALLTGLDGFGQGVHSSADMLPRDLPRPLDGLARDGWRVAGLQAFMLINQFQSLGLLMEPGEALLPWLASRRLEGRPFFVWHHYLETHLPYAPAPAFMPDWQSLLPANDAAARARMQMVMTQSSIPAGSVAWQQSDRPAIAALHAGTLRQFDAWFGEFWRFFNDSGLRNTTILVVTADHGDEHLERGQVGHASTTRAGHLHEEVLRIPLFVWLPPDLQATPQQLHLPTDHTQVMPSLLSWLGRQSSAPPLLGPSERFWSGLTSHAGIGEPDPYHVRAFHAARIESDWKLHHDYSDGRLTEARLYNLSDDPGETANRLEGEPATAARLGAALDAAFVARQQPVSAVAPAAGGDVPAPRWLEPAGSRALRFADVKDRFRLAWSGAAGVGYRIEYEAGEKFMTLNGTLENIGPERTFTGIDEQYWRTYILPYQRVRLRVGPVGRDDAWSDWLELRALP
jgi:choline-sulfatase